MPSDTDKHERRVGDRPAAAPRAPERLPAAALAALIGGEAQPLAAPLAAASHVTASAVGRCHVGLTVDGRYQIEERIAAGGMGVVYRCRHVALGKKLAIKIIRADVALLPEGLDRFLLEAKAASSIGNEHIVDISDFGRLADGSPYLVMEFLDGVSLSAWQEREQPLSPGRIACVAGQIAEALGAAHAAGIVHRDLKPDNVFVLERRGEDFVKILDFGVARMADGSKKLTQAGTIVGTPHYMSPEQAAGREVDHRSDIYALGVILYELCTGRVPFDGAHYMAVLHQHLQTPPPPLTVRGGEAVPAELDRIVSRCLAKLPAQRYPSMAALGRDLSELRGRCGVAGAWLAPAAERAAAGTRGQTLVLQRAGSLPAASRLQRRVSAAAVAGLLATVAWAATSGRSGPALERPARAPLAASPPAAGLGSPQATRRSLLPESRPAPPARVEPPAKVEVAPSPEPAPPPAARLAPERPAEAPVSRPASTPAPGAPRVAPVSTKPAAAPEARAARSPRAAARSPSPSRGRSEFINPWPAPR